VGFLKTIRRAPQLIRCLAFSREPLRLLHAYLFRRQWVGPISVRLWSGIEIETEDWDELTTVWHVFFGNEYLIPREAKSILDLGGNIGAFSLMASSRAPQAKIFSVEPFPDTFLRLKSSVVANRLSDRVIAIQAAIVGEDSTRFFDATTGKRSYCRAIV